MASPTDREWREQQARIRRLMAKWKDILPLGQWTISTVYCRAGLVDSRNNRTARCTAETHADWRYLHATIKWDIVEVMEVSDKDLEAIVVHEYLHVLTDALARYAKQEYDGAMDSGQVEQAVSMLGLAILWTRDHGIAEGRRLAKKATALVTTA